MVSQEEWRALEARYATPPAVEDRPVRVRRAANRRQARSRLNRRQVARALQAAADSAADVSVTQAERAVLGRRYASPLHSEESPVRRHRLQNRSRAERRVDVAAAHRRERLNIINVNREALLLEAPDPFDTEIGRLTIEPLQLHNNAANTTVDVGPSETLHIPQPAGGTGLVRRRRTRAEIEESMRVNEHVNRAPNGVEDSESKRRRLARLNQQRLRLNKALADLQSYKYRAAAHASCQPFR
ncbi:hypothetical protein GN958_ATG20277 [Phytophthora infestans]|nr:hypothetical protein GN958_ATG20277 [Phytophthora infestans]